MLIESSKSLKFQCGPYGLLVDIAHISAIEDYGKSRLTSSKDTTYESENFILWNSFELRYIDLRLYIGIEKSKLKDPSNVLILKDTSSDMPFAMVAIDEVSHIIEIQESHWYELKGINPQLDMFFDRAYLDKESGQILMRLAPIEHWVTGNIGGHDAY